MTFFYGQTHFFGESAKKNHKPLFHQVLSLSKFFIIIYYSFLCKIYNAFFSNSLMSNINKSKKNTPFFNGVPLFRNLLYRDF